MPEEVTNRARDNWRVLKAIAIVAGGNSPPHRRGRQGRAGAVADEASRLEFCLRTSGPSGSATMTSKSDRLTWFSI